MELNYKYQPGVDGKRPWAEERPGQGNQGPIME